MYYTYLWLREDGTPYYVGKGTGNRAYVRHRIGNSPPLGRIVFYIAKDEAESLENEVALIWYYGRRDLGLGCLRNFTNGGEGVSGGTWKLTERTKENISNSLKGNTRNKGRKYPNGYISKGRKYPDGYINKGRSRGKCEAISKSLMGNKRLLGYKHSEAAKQKIRDARRLQISKRTQIGE